MGCKRRDEESSGETKRVEEWREKDSKGEKKYKKKVDGWMERRG